MLVMESDTIPYFSVTPECDKPVIANGTVSPANAAVEQGQSYNVTCDSGYTINGTTTIMTCQADTNFDRTPTCEGTSKLVNH